MQWVLIVINTQHKSKVVIPKAALFPTLQLVLFYTSNKNLVQTLSSKSYNLVICCGGDGTIHHTINSIKQSSSKCALGILPIGSGNDFVRNYTPHSSIQEILKAYINGSLMAIDLILYKSNNQKIYSINILEIGLGGKVIQFVERLKPLLGASLAYSISILLGFLFYSSDKISLTVNGLKYNEKFLLIAIGNGKYFGNKIGICPQAKINDGLLSVSFVKDISVFTYLSLLPKLKRGEFIIHPKLEYVSTKKLTINNFNKLPIEADGEYLGAESCTVNVVPKAINLVT